MKINKIKTATDMLEMKLGELYDIENQIVKALSKLSKKVTDEELKTSFEQHLEETQVQVRRLEQAFEHLERKPHKAKSEGIRGIVSDCEMFLSADLSAEVRDALVVSAARSVEHYEMAGYLAASSLANQLGLRQVEALLQESLAEEEAADKHLSTLAQKLSESLVEDTSV